MDSGIATRRLAIALKWFVRISDWNPRSGTTILGPGIAGVHNSLPGNNAVEIEAIFEVE